jgi:type III secretion system YscQ/HrcQ family protein
MTVAAPYPFQRWPRMQRRDAARLRQCVRTVAPRAPERAAERASELLGVPVRVQPAVPQTCSAEGLDGWLSEPLVAAILEPPEAGAGRIALELDPWLAACIVDRTLGGEAGEALAPPTTPLGEVERGVLAYVLGRTLAMASDRPWRLCTVVTTLEAFRAAVGEAGAVVWPATVTLGGDRSAAWVWVPETSLAALQSPQPGPAATALFPIEVELAVHAGRAALPAGDARTLRAGDVVVLDQAWARPGSAPAGAQAQLPARIVGARRTTWWCTAEASALRLARIEHTEDPPIQQGRRMSDDPTETDPVLEQAGDAPIDVSVELARFTMPLEELGALRTGEVVATGRAVGERVTLRAGGHALAVGELVDVDGEVGVRLLRVGSDQGADQK